MSITRRVLAVAAVAATVGWLPAVPATAAATMVATVSDAQLSEHVVVCGDSPGPCAERYAQRFRFHITVSNYGGRAITFDFDLQNITATEGVDFQSWQYNPPFKVTTGSDGKATIYVDTIVDSLNEPTETFRVRLTAASRPVDISDTAIGTLVNGSHLPPDCSAYRVDTDTGRMTCTSRPAAQQWRSYFRCGGWAGSAFGNVVTGNGTSEATCVFEEPWLMGEVNFSPL